MVKNFEATTFSITVELSRLYTFKVVKKEDNSHVLTANEVHDGVPLMAYVEATEYLLKNVGSHFVRVDYPGNTSVFITEKDNVEAFLMGALMGEMMKEHVMIFE